MIQARVGILLVGALLGTALPASVYAQAPGASLSLSEALEAALDRNPALAAAEAQQGIAEAKARAARSGYFPQVRLSATYHRYEEPSIVVPIHQAGVFPPLDNDIYEGLAHVSVPLFNGGRTGAAYRAAKATARGAQVQRDLTTTDLLRGVAQIFIRAEELNDRRALLATRLSALRERRRELELLLEEGRVAPGNLAQITATIERARSDSLEVELADFQTSTQLGQLVGGGEPLRPAPAQSRPAFGSLEDLAPGKWNEETWGSGVQLRRAQLDAAKALRAEASGAFWPEISGFATYILRSGDELDGTGEWVAGLGIALPLFDGGRRAAVRSAASATVNVAQEQLRAERESQAAVLSLAVDQWQTSGARRNHLAAAAEAQSVSVSSHERLYEAGRLSLSDFLTQEAELLELRIAERAAVSAVRLAVLDYHAVLDALTPALAETIVRSSP